MKTQKLKQMLSLILAIVMLLTMVPVGSYAAESTSYPVIKAFTSVAGDFHAYKTEIVTVTILDYIDEAEYAACSPYAWDISASSTTGTVKAWMKVNEEETAAAGATRYDVYIGGSGGVAANAYSADLFWNFKNLKEIKGLENFDTSNATNFSYMFNMCESLESLDLSSWDTSNATTFLWMFHSCYKLKDLNLSGWDTSSVTNMNSMFKNCKSITELDISSFDTSNVTNMNSMFFNCIVLSNLYVGKGWNIENVKDGNMAFNCCDALPGFDPNNSEASINFADKYVKPESEKPQPEAKTYTVTYEFIGDIIPDGVTAPEAVTYDEGSTVSVATKPSANGYEFSGWSTEDASVAEDETFTINNDVHFVGSWSKLYTVTYKYTDNSEKPEGMPDLTGYTASYKAGETVKIKNALDDIGRFAFVGWDTKEVETTDDGTIFVMPERDVVIYGLYKIPVEEVIIDHEHDEIIFNNGKDENETFELNVFVDPPNATFPEVVVESTDESVVKVNRDDDKIILEAVGDGEATIIVYSKDDPTKRDTIEVTVKTPVTDLTATEDFVIYTTDEPKNVDASVNEDATNKELIYKSSDPEIAEVDENGNVTPKKPGTVTITITSKDNTTITETVEVTVKNPVTELTAKDDFTIEIEEVENLDAKVNEDATDKTLIYETSDPGVVKVDSDGNVVGVSEGTATITITSVDNPSISETVVVTVVKYFNVTYAIVGDIQLDSPTAPDGGRYLNGTEITVEADLSATGYTFSGWALKTDGVTVENGKFIIDRDVHFEGSWADKFYNVTYEYTGEIIPTDAPVYNPETYREGSEVTVKVNPEVDGYIFSGWDKTGSFNIYEDTVITGTWSKLYNVHYEYIGTVPANAPKCPSYAKYTAGTTVTIAGVPTVEGYTFIGWTTDDVTANNNSFAMPSKDVTLKGRFEKIKVPVSDITVNKTTITLKVDETDKIVATVTPENATDKSVTYTSSDKSVVTVDANGNVTAVGVGQAIIVVRSVDNSEIFEVISVTINVPDTFDPEPEPDPEPEKPEEPDLKDPIMVPSQIEIFEGDTKDLEIIINDETIHITSYSSADPSIATVDANGKITGVGIGKTKIKVTFSNGQIRYIPVSVVATSETSHYIVFGKTEKIGWYNVSKDGGKTWQIVFGNSNLVLPKGTQLVIKAVDIMGDPFTFYINGKAVTPDENGYVYVDVQEFMLIGALGIPVIAPDAEESLTWIQKIIKSIKDFFAKIASWFKR